MPSASPQERNVLLLAYSYPPDSAAGASRPARFAKFLPEFGYNACVLTASQQTMACDANVTWVSDPHPSWERRFWRMIPSAGLAWMKPAIDASMKLLGQTWCGLVFSTSPPVTSHIVAYQIKRRTGLPWVADLRDPIRSVERRRRRPNQMFDPFIERFVFRHADALIANTDSVAELWKRRYPRHASKTFVIWNGFDPQEEVLPRMKPRSGRRVLLHAGDLYRNRHAGLLLEALQNLVQNGNDAVARLNVRFLGVPDNEVDFFIGEHRRPPGGRDRGVLSENKR